VITEGLFFVVAQQATWKRVVLRGDLAAEAVRVVRPRVPPVRRGAVRRLVSRRNAQRVCSNLSRLYTWGNLRYQVSVIFAEGLFWW